MATKIKHTWWGDQWLKAIDKFDYHHKIKTGRTFANKGAITGVTMYGSTVIGRVKDTTRIRPYSTTLVFPSFTEAEKEGLVNQIKENNLFIIRLLNNELPPEILDMAGKVPIHIFPQSWQDIKMSCECKERSHPCRHIGATLYMITKEIELNPFHVFKLHNFDILSELRSRKVIFGYQQSEKIYSLRDALSTTWRGYDNTNPAHQPIPDYTTIDNLSGTIADLFVAKTIFFTGDIKPHIQLIYKKAVKEFIQPEKESTEPPVIQREGLRNLDYTLIFFYDLKVEIEAKRGRDRITVTWEQLLQLLITTEPRHLSNYSASFIAIYRTFLFCKILVERGAILPRLFNCDGEGFKMLWVPALLNTSVKNVFDVLLPCIPNNMLKLSANSVSSRRRSYTPYVSLPTKTKDAEKSEAMVLFCAFLINPAIENAYKHNKLSRVSKKDDRKIVDLFFGNTVVAFDGFHERSVPNNIQLWLKRFYNADKHFVPVLQVTETAKKEGFNLEILVQHNKTELKEHQPLHSFLELNESEHKMHLLKDLILLGEYYPDLNNLVETGGKEGLHYAAESFTDILLKIFPVLQLFGIKALLPKSLQSIAKPMMTLSLTSSKTKRTYFTLDGLMDYNWQVAMGDTFISQQEFENLSRSTMGLVRIRDQYILMDEAQVKKIIQNLQKPARLSGIDLLQAALSGDYERAPVFVDETLKQQINDLLKEEEILLPAGLLATLRPYQQRGFNWMYKNSKLGIGSLLADDMGLGKTLQVITAILKFKEEGLLKNSPALVIVPTTLLTNWVIEMQRFAPDLNSLVFHGQGRTFNLKDIDVVVTTYGIARTENEMLCNQKWYVVVVDEAQNIKNPEIAQTKSVKKIKGHIKIAMSGTPVENRLSEYWSIFDFANPNYLGSINWFETNYARPIELYHDVVKLDKFKAITSPFILRRMKTDKNIIDDLPEKVESNQFCILTKEQAALYQNLTHDLMKQIEQSDGINRRGMVLKLLTVLKQICNHPANYLKNAEAHPELSGKTLLLLQLLETIYENKEKVIIFSQYQEMGTILKEVINKHFGKDSLQLHGGSTRQERDDMVEDFQNNDMTDTFILSIKAGGTGLNLTAAANVIHYDLWWNPAVEAQATDRAFRIGQHKNVMVHRMITKGTLEEKIDEMLRSKKHLADMTVSHGEHWVGDLTDKELQELISFGEE